MTEEYLLLFSRVMKDSSYGGWEAEGGLPSRQGFGGPRPHYANSDVFPETCFFIISNVHIRCSQLFYSLSKFFLCVYGLQLVSSFFIHL